MKSEYVTQFEENNTSSVSEKQAVRPVPKCTDSVLPDTVLSSEATFSEELSLEELDYAPHLIRKSTGERVDIAQNVFKIGKKVGYSDYIVQGNSAVSRMHADIIWNDETFYIRDNGSTNGTFVDGVRIPAQNEIEIFDGDDIRLANECFEFHLI